MYLASSPPTPPKRISSYNDTHQMKSTILDNTDVNHILLLEEIKTKFKKEKQGIV